MMNATIIKGAPVEDKISRRVGWRKRRGVVEIPQYCHAIDRLQEHGYITEMWVEKNKGIVTLRWAKPGSHWHVTARAQHIRDQLTDISKAIILWLNEVDRKRGNESIYAVREV